MSCTSIKFALLVLVSSAAWAQNPIDIDLNAKGSRLPCSRPDTGTADHYVVTCKLSNNQIRVGSEIKFTAVNANTGASDLNVDGAGAIAMKKWQTGTLVDLIAGDIPAGAAVDAWYDGTQFQIVVFGGSPAMTGTGTNGVTVCLITTGDPGGASPFLADDNDSPAQCGNDFATDKTIVAVACWADAGSPVIEPILTGGGATSILSSDLTCGTASWAPGTVNGTPVLHSFSANGSTCSSTPCTLDANIVTAGGVAKYMVVKIDLK